MCRGTQLLQPNPDAAAPAWGITHRCAACLQGGRPVCEPVLVSIVPHPHHGAVQLLRVWAALRTPPNRLQPVRCRTSHAATSCSWLQQSRPPWRSLPCSGPLEGMTVSAAEHRQLVALGQRCLLARLYNRSGVCTFNLNPIHDTMFMCILV